jgi:hypothetical protein
VGGILSKVGNLLLLLVSIAFCLELKAQSGDSFHISLVPLSEIATTAANDLQNTRDLLLQRIQVTNQEIGPQIDTLDSQVLSLKDKSDQILKTSSKFSYYNSLIQRWERISSEIEPLHVILKDYSKEMEGIRDSLQTWQLKWNIRLYESDPVPPDDILSRIEAVYSYMDSTR